ncbi:MAG: DHA2 family efflux MFS transporter permease subunit, partial [Candidatus Methanomethylophilaceae archaeon]|nr:DHA2 family efflux MFS transporter permease subunit [Candidatus Methanomethylophilaceae archaeon]
MTFISPYLTGKVMSGGSNKIILFALVLGTFMTALDATIVSVALPTMAEELGEAGHDTSNISWVLLVYTLMLCCFILLWSKIGSNIGYKKVFMTGISLFAVTSLAIGLCGFVEELGLRAIIVLRAVQGMGAGMSMSVSLAMVSSYLPPEIRGSSIGAVTLAASAGSAFGPALGGLLTTFHWSYIFFINVPIGALCIILCMRYMKVRESLPPERPKLDFPGALFMLLMLFPLIYYLNVGADIGWISNEGLGLLMLTFLGAGLLFWWEQRAKDPLVSLRLMGESNIVRACLISMVMFMAMAGSYLLLPYYLQFVQGYETMEYGLILIANSVGMMVSGPLIGRVADRTGNNRIFIICGTLTTALGFFLMTMFDRDTQLWFILLALFVMGAGLGMAMVSSTNLAFGYIREGE